jgi:hypothetical protein
MEKCAECDALDHLNNAGGLNDWGSLLAFRKFLGFFVIGVYAAELLSVVVIDGNKKMPVFAAFVFSEGGLFSFFQVSSSLHISMMVYLIKHK